jgi:hypothetical protein
MLIGVPATKAGETRTAATPMAAQMRMAHSRQAQAPSGPGIAAGVTHPIHATPCRA